MALNIINDPSLTSQLSTGIGQGLSQLLSSKAQNLVARQQRQQLAQGLQAIPGMTQSPQMAEQLASLPPELLQLVVKQQLAAPGNASFSNALSQILGGPSSEIEPNGQQPAQVPLAGLNAEQATRLAKLHFQKKAAERKEEQETKKTEHQQQNIANKETKAYYDNTLALNEAAGASEKRLNQMENLITKKGGLPISSFYKLFKNLEEHVPATYGAAAGAAAGASIGGAPGAAVGGVIGGLISPVATLLRSAQAFTSPNLEVFEKLSNDFVREAKSIFGSRITDQDLKVFMSLVPSLSQTDNGKLAIIKNMRNFLEANKVKANAMKQIVKENKGKRPFDLSILVEERAKPELDKLAKDFIV